MGCRFGDEIGLQFGISAIRDGVRWPSSKKLDTHTNHKRAKDRVRFSSFNLHNIKLFKHSGKTDDKNNDNNIDYNSENKQ